MPTDRFYRLPEQKRKVIRDAARKEFARVPFEKASINQIIRNAKISRGSFYTYFSDKQDVMEFVLDEDFAKMWRLCEETLDLNGGEYLGMLKVLFEYMVERLQSTKEIMDIVKNVFAHNDKDIFPECTLETVSSIFDGEKGDASVWLINKVDKKRLRIQTPEELQSLILLGASAMVTSIKQYYLHPDRLEEVRDLFETKLDILKHGAYRLQPAE